LSTIRQMRPGSGCDGTPSKTSCVALLSSGPYATYEWPVIQPQSAVQKKVSSGFRSKTYLVVVAA